MSRPPWNRVVVNKPDHRRRAIKCLHFHQCQIDFLALLALGSGRYALHVVRAISGKMGYDWATPVSEPEADTKEPPSSSAIRPPGTRRRQAANAICQYLMPATFSVCKRKVRACIQRVRYLQAWHLLVGAGPVPFLASHPNPEACRSTGCGACD